MEERQACASARDRTERKPRDFDEACQSSKVTSVESHSMGLFINLWCACVCARNCMKGKEGGGNATLTESWQPPTCQY